MSFRRRVRTLIIPTEGLEHRLQIVNEVVARVSERSSSRLRDWNRNGLANIIPNPRQNAHHPD